MNTIDNQEETPSVKVKELPPLIRKSDTYKLIVPSKVEEKIRYLLRKFPNTEWSGVLFTSHTGSFEKKNLVITCEDIYPMDLGNSTFTDFQMNADVASYMAQNMELFDCDLQLIHSHHSMSAFFSGTDTRTLQEEGNERNCFVSLIVNNEGTYCAAVTRKVQTKSEVSIKSLGTSYKFFGEGDVKVEGGDTKKTEVIDKEFIEYFMLDVERNTVSNPLEYLDARFEEIVKHKAAKSVEENRQWPNTSTTETPWYHQNEEDIDYDWYNGRQYTPKQTSLPSLFGEADYSSIIPDEELIDDAIARILTLSLHYPSGAFNIDRFVNNIMKNIYDGVFSNLDVEALTGVNPFESWADFIIEFVVTNFEDPSIPQELLYEDYDSYYKIIATAIYKKLEKYREANDYMEGYLNTLKRYMK